MIQIVANTNPLIPFQFPEHFRAKGPTFVSFVRAFYQWMEQTDNTGYYTRNYYNIKDIDNTFDQFIVYFKEKYLKNLHFSTVADIRQVIKHATDIYRSKGTERCAQLIFQIAFGKPISFYYPSKDLFKLSDGTWYVPQYLELTLNWNHNLFLEQKEIIGLQSGATAFVDSIVRRKTNNRFQDVAYISAVNGLFQTGERVQPTDLSLSVPDCPTITGSLNSLTITELGVGQNYTVGTVVPISSLYGNGALGRVANTINNTGVVKLQFNEGGYGYQTNATVYVSNVVLQIANLQMNTANLEIISYFEWMDQIKQPMATINYVSANNSFAAGMNVFTYFGNNSQMGSGVVLAVTPANTTAGVIVVNVLSGNMQNTFYTTGNAIAASLAISNGYTNTTATGNFIANTSTITVHINNINGTFFNGEVVSQPIRPELAQKEGGFAVALGIAGNTTVETISVANLEGRFVQNNIIIGASSGATANVTGIDIYAGFVNVTSNPFVASIYSYATTPQTNGIVNVVSLAGTGFSVSIANSLSFTENVRYNTDVLSTYSAISLNAFSYNFPANSAANMIFGTIGGALALANLTIGKLNSVFLSGLGNNFSYPPFIVIDQPQISDVDLYNDILEITGSAINFAVGEVVSQAATSARGLVTSESNTTFLYLQRMRYANDFVNTTNSTTTIVGLNSGSTANVINVDYDILSPVMGRNANVQSIFGIGNSALVEIQIVDSGYGFLEGETATIGSNGATGTVVTNNQGSGSGYYQSVGGFLSDQKKLFDGYYWQNFSYQINSPIMFDRYQQMIKELTHVAGTILFGNYIFNTSDNNSINIVNATLNITNSYSVSETAAVTAVDKGTYIWRHANGAANTAGNV